MNCSNWLGNFKVIHKGLTLELCYFRNTYLKINNTILPELCEGECEGDCIEMTGWVNVIPWALGISLTLIWPSDVAFRVEGCKGLAFEELVVDGLKKDIKKLKIEKIYLEYIHKMILDQDIIQKN